MIFFVNTIEFIFTIDIMGNNDNDESKNDP